MNAHLTPDEELLFDLIETKNYADLSPAEKEWVNRHFSQEEYEARRAILQLAPSAFDELSVLPVPPLKPAVNTLPVYKRPIPLYQALMAVAAVTLIFLFAPFQDPVLPSQTERVVQHDTLEVEKLIRDTIVQIREKPVIVEKVVYRSVNEPIPAEIPGDRINEPAPRLDLLPIESPMLENTGTSLRDESTAVLIRDYFR